MILVYILSNKGTDWAPLTLGELLTSRGKTWLYHLHNTTTTYPNTNYYIQSKTHNQNTTFYYEQRVTHLK